MKARLLVLLALSVLLAAPAASQERCAWSAPSYHGGLAHAPGFAGSFWTTDLVAANAGEGLAVVRLTFAPGGASLTLSVEPGTVAYLPDVVAVAGLPDGAYAASTETCDVYGGLRPVLTTRTPFAGGFLAVQLPQLMGRDYAVLPLVDGRDSRAAVYVVTEPEGRWRIQFYGAGGLLGAYDGFGTGFGRIEPPAGALYATFTRFPWAGGPGGCPDCVMQDRAFAYVTFADAVTSSPAVVQ